MLFMKTEQLEDIHILPAERILVAVHAMQLLRLGLPILLFASIPLFGDEIPSGTKIVIRTNTMVSSDQSQSGDPVDAVLADDLIVKGKRIAPEGAVAHAIVVYADPSRGGKMPLPGSVSLRLESIETSQGIYRLSTNQYTRQGHGRPVTTPIGGAGISIDSGGGVHRQPTPGLPDSSSVSVTSNPEAVIPAQSVITFKTSGVSRPKPKD
jgi:hypothetical protein